MYYTYTLVSNTFHGTLTITHIQVEYVQSVNGHTCVHVKYTVHVDTLTHIQIPCVNTDIHETYSLQINNRDTHTHTCT